MRVGLVIPAWEEAESIRAVLAEVPPRTVDDVVVVVGGPDDPTGPVALAAGARVVVPEQRGYGAACWAGAQAACAAGADVLVFLDGDYADPPAALPRVLAPVLAGTADLALGIRGGPGLPVHARLGNALVLALLRVVLPGQRPPLMDLPSFKALRADALARLAPRERTYGWTVELLVKAARLNLCVAQVPVAYRPRLGGRSKVSGTLRGTLGAAWKLGSCAVRYATWMPPVAAQEPDRTLAGAPMEWRT